MQIARRAVMIFALGALSWGGSSCATVSRSSTSEAFQASQYETEMAMGMNRLSVGAYDAAEEHLKKARKLARNKSEKARAEAGLGGLEMARGEYDRAQKKLEKALREDDTAADGWLYLAKLHTLQGDTLGAIGILDEGRRRAPDRPDVEASLGYLLLAFGSAPQAVMHFENALAREPNKKTWQEGLAHAQYAAGITPSLGGAKLTRIDESELYASQDIAPETATTASEPALERMNKGDEDKPRMLTRIDPYGKPIASAGETGTADSGTDPEPERAEAAQDLEYDRPEAPDDVLDAADPLTMEPSEKLLDRLEKRASQLERSQTLTRADLAVLLTMRGPMIRPWPGTGDLPHDVREHPYAEAIAVALFAGWMERLPDGKFYPDDVVHRAQAAILFQSQVRRYPALHKRMYQPVPEIADVPPSDFAYPAIATMVRTDVMLLDDDGRFRPGDPLSGADGSRIASEFALALEAGVDGNRQEARRMRPDSTSP